jgi:hypothetical protein
MIVYQADALCALLEPKAVASQIRCIGFFGDAGKLRSKKTPFKMRQL